MQQPSSAPHDEEFELSYVIFCQKTKGLQLMNISVFAAFPQINKKTPIEFSKKTLYGVVSNEALCPLGNHTCDA